MIVIMIVFVSVSWILSINVNRLYTMSDRSTGNARIPQFTKNHSIASNTPEKKC